MGKRGRRIRKLQRQHEVNHHHLLYPRRDWSQGYAYLVRHAFIREVPVDIHNRLHRYIVKEVPVPSEKLLRGAWESYQQDKTTIDSYDIRRALAWLYVNIQDTKFRKEIQKQIDFFTESLGGSD
jgi:hypothetical protein